jgi:hypothetical protein
VSALPDSVIIVGWTVSHSLPPLRVSKARRILMSMLQLVEPSWRVVQVGCIAWVISFLAKKLLNW